MNEIQNGKRVRIGIDVTAAVSQGGGIGRYTRELVRTIVSVDRNREYHLFSARQPRKLSFPDAIPTASHVSYHQAPISEQWLYRIWHRLRLPLPVQWFTGGLDLFHSPDFVLPPTSSHIPTLLTVHDLSFVHYPDTFTPSLVNYLTKVVPSSVTRASHILADSQATKADLVSLWNVPAHKVTVLLSGVSSEFRPVTDKDKLDSVRRKYHLGNRPYLFSVSTLQPRKNYQMLIRAFQPIAQKHPHNLIIAGGKGWMYEQMIAEVADQNLAGRVHFVGYAEDVDLPALYSDATLFVFPSLYEGFGLPLLEAMACGVPVLASNASCLPEVAGEAAELRSPHDQSAWTQAIEYLLLDTTRRMEMVAAGFLQARHFTWKKAAHQLVDIYRQLVSP